MIELTPAGAVLLPPPGGLRSAKGIERDIVALGEILQQLFPADPAKNPSTKEPDRMSPEGIAAAARRMAAQCIADPPLTGWSVQKAVNEFRFLDLMARRHQTEEPEIRTHPPMSTIWQTRNTDLEVEPEMETPEPVAAPVVVAPKKPLMAKSDLASQFLLEEEEIPKLEESEIECPRCKGPYVHPSTTKSEMEEALEFFKMPPLRCHRCSYRFIKVLGLNVRKEA